MGSEEGIWAILASQMGPEEENMAILASQEGYQEGYPTLYASLDHPGIPSPPIIPWFVGIPGSLRLAMTRRCHAGCAQKGPEVGGKSLLAEGPQGVGMGVSDLKKGSKPGISVRKGGDQGPGAGV